LKYLCNLLFELSNEDRLRILYQVAKEPMNITNLAKLLDLTIQESSRHVSRLTEAGLTQKDADGSHRLTPYGELVLEQLPGLTFISKQRDYFTSHPLTTVPMEFVDRIGDLSNSTYMDDVMVVIRSVEMLIQGAKEYVWNLNDQYVASSFRLIGEALKRGVKTRSIDLKHYTWDPKIRSALSDEVIEAIKVARTSGLLKERVLEKIEVFLWISEREAVVALPRLDGKFDYLGFTSTDDRARKWCMDVFDYYWEKAAQ